MDALGNTNSVLARPAARKNPAVTAPSATSKDYSEAARSEEDHLE